MEVQVSLETVGTGNYQTLSNVVATLQPVALPGWEDFAVLSNGPIGSGFIRTSRPVQAYRYNYRYGPTDSRTRTVEDWYLLGPYLVKISATAASEIWLNDEHLEVRRQMELVLDTFEPSAFTDTQNIYSVAHPPSWQVLPGDVADYWAEDAVEEQRVLIRVRSALGHTNVETYANDDRILAGETLRQIVFTGRSNPSYRIEYTMLSLFLDIGTLVKGVALITLSGTDAIWLHVEGPPEDWEVINALANDLLARFAVRS